MAENNETENNETENDGTQTPPQHIEVAFDDGSSTGLTVVATETADAPVVLCLPAMGVRASYYEILADALAEEGFHAVLADHRGSGESSVRASRKTDFGYAELLGSELPGIIEAIRKEFGVDKVAVVGHSLGGQMGLLHAATSDHISHVVAVASGSAWYRRVPGVRGVGRFLGLQLMSTVTLLWGYLPTWLPFAGREARGVMRDWGYEAMTGRYKVRGSSVDYDEALARSTVPALFITFPDDPFVPRPCADHLAGKLTTADVTHLELPPERFRLPKTDHFRWVMRPGAVAETVAQWIK
jgi:predicted alpha/beta hydrolase